MTPPKSSLDVYAFARDAAGGHMTQRELAERHGISRATVRRLLAGGRSGRVARLVAELRADLLKTARLQARRQLARLGGKAVGALEQAMDKPHTSVALGAAKEVLHRVLDETDDERLDRPAEETPSLAGLSPQTRRLVLEELGGPQDDEPSDDGPQDGGPRDGGRSRPDDSPVN